ncbi:MAG: metallophosphoesterase family protein [Phycisphaerales bacterium]|nr:metallophosphoesterase family protein [Phycisphaerales bacterium]
MKLLIFSDLHTSADAARSLLARASEVDVLVGAGDFANQHRGLEICLDILRACTRPAVIVPGNNETPDALRDACRAWPSARVLHGQRCEIMGRAFFGLGGAVPETPFGPWSFDLSEERARTLLAPCPAGCVLVSHSPPKGAADRTAEGLSMGSEAVRDTVERVAPALVVCGHVHASAGREARIGAVTVINAGPAGRIVSLP